MTELTPEQWQAVRNVVGHTCVALKMYEHTRKWVHVNNISQETVRVPVSLIKVIQDMAKQLDIHPKL